MPVGWGTRSRNVKQCGCALTGFSQLTSRTLRKSPDPQSGGPRCLSERFCWSKKTAVGGCIASPSPPAETTWPGWPTTAASVWLMAPRGKSECLPCKSVNEWHSGTRVHISFSQSPGGSFMGHQLISSRIFSFPPTPPGWPSWPLITCQCWACCVSAPLRSWVL